MAADLTVDGIEDKIVLLQALFRGFLARKKLLEVQREYEEVLYELENGASFVYWKGEALGFPLTTYDPKNIKSTYGENSSSINGERITHSEKPWPETTVIPAHRRNVERNGDEGPLLKYLTPSTSNTESSNSVKETSVVKSTKEGENEVDFRHREHDKGEMSENYERPPLEKPTLEGLNSESFNDQAVGLESQTTSLQGDKPRIEIAISREQSPEKPPEGRSFFIPHAEVTSQCDGQDGGFPHNVAESPLPLNSTFKHGSEVEQEMGSFGQSDSASEASLQACVLRKPYLKEQAILSDTWLTDRSFDTVLDEETTKEIPTDPVKLHQLRDHIGMELLWTEQAIQSRKKYLGLRKGLAQNERDDSITHCD